jgi:hypothetical protein
MGTFKWLVRFRILSNLLVGTALIVAPQLPFDWMSELAPPAEQIWLVKLVGIWLIYAAIAHVASALAPTIAMSSNLFVVLGPILPIVLIIWLGVGAESRALLMLAVYELVFVILLSRSFQTGWLEDLNTKP